MAGLKPGLYEQLLSLSLKRELDALSARHHAELDRLHPAEAPDRISLHLARLIKRAVESLDDDARALEGLELARRIIGLLMAQDASGTNDSDQLLDSTNILRSISALLPTGGVAKIPLPDTPLLDTTLLTNAQGEPNIGHQLRTEIPSADRIDVLMAFVRKSGIRPLLELLHRHGEGGRSLRVLTTTYTGSTELAALQDLQQAGANIRISYDTTSTRLHAKAWLFHRDSGFSTAYIGSSNLTHSAQVTGLEWNVRVSGARNPDVIDKFCAVFESYWNNEDFRPFDVNEFREMAQREKSPGLDLMPSPVEIRPEPFQVRLLELIELSRQRGRHRNLLVAATGTGKTVMAALDYQRLRARLPRARLLFVAHRKEILNQSLLTFRHALRDAAFGELWVDGQKPNAFQHVFASIQSLAVANLQHLDADWFDVLIIDEFHHAAADTYKALIDHLEPREMLGLTATPERGDGEPILHWFDESIAAELRLWDAIDQHRLCPFAYYGISDGTDLTRIGWRRGSGYDIQQLTNLVTGDGVVARLVIEQTRRHVSDMASMRALGFCVSITHAQFMAAQFEAAGVSALALTSQTPMLDREAALRDLESGKLQIVFTVDLFNEGVDIPSVDTLLFLRPTDSATLFLQQLGRGLRRFPNKTVCTVLDFVGRHRKEFRFSRRLGALLGGTRAQTEKQVEQGFPFLPSGCHMQLDAVASAEVLRNLRECLPRTSAARASELRRFAATIPERPTLAAFLQESGLELTDIYSGNYAWSDLLHAAGIPILAEGPQERTLRKAMGRLLHLDDNERICTYRDWARSPNPPDAASLVSRQRCLLHMLLAQILQSAQREGESLEAGAAELWKHPQVLDELGQLMDVLESRIDHIHQPLDCRPDAPLQLHARYTRPEILMALGETKVKTATSWREGVKWMPEQNADVFVFTLDKSGKRFSPTTRYRDYAVSPRIIHWESQSTTSAASPTGTRYQHHVQQGSIVLLFARLSPDDRAFWFLGPARYMSHQGERPMAIHWELEQPLPGDLFQAFGAAVA